MITEAGNSLDLSIAEEGRGPNDSGGVGLDVYIYIYISAC